MAIYRASQGVTHKNGKTWDPTKKLSNAKREDKGPKKEYMDEKSFHKAVAYDNGRNTCNSNKD